MYKIVTHLHTKYSKDSLMPFYLLYRKCMKNKIDYIAITEHNNLQGALQFKKYCESRNKHLKVILGEEIMTTEGEIIGLYLTREIKPFMTPEETVNEIKKQEGIVYVPHPYDLKRYKTVLREDAIRRLSTQIDCIECHNGRNISKEYDFRQNEIADKYKIKKVIGSDAHTIFEVGRNYMMSSFSLDTAQDFLEALDTFKFCPSECREWCHQLTRIDRGIKLIQKGDINGFCRAIAKKFKRRKS